MRCRSLCLVLGLALAACTAPRTSPPPAADLAGMEKEIAATRDAIHQLEARLGQLETQLSAANPDGEFTVMTIDTVESAASRGSAFGMGEEASKALLCHVVEWRGFGKMKRFTQLADHQFSLEAHGHPSVVAHMSEGGINNTDGSIRYVMLYPSTALKPGVQYQVRPRNQNEKYKWSVAHGVTLAAN